MRLCQVVLAVEAYESELGYDFVSVKNALQKHSNSSNVMLMGASAASCWYGDVTRRRSVSVPTLSYRSSCRCKLVVGVVSSTDRPSARLCRESFLPHEVRCRVDLRCQSLLHTRSNVHHDVGHELYDRLAPRLPSSVFMSRSVCNPTQIPTQSVATGGGHPQGKRG